MSKLNKLTLIPYTVSHAVSLNRLDWLMDDEVIALYSGIYEDSDSPIYDLYDAQEGSDNNILTPIQHIQESGSWINSAHSKDYRYGVHFYFNVFFPGKSVRLIVRELDSFIHPPSTDIFTERLLYNCLSSPLSGIYRLVKK